MKSTERQQLKQNQFAVATMRMVDQITANWTRIAIVAGTLAVLLLAVGVVFTMVRRSADAAGTMLGAAMTIAQAQISLDSALPGVNQSAGTFPTEEARFEATVAAFREVIDAHPSSDAAVAARFHLASEYAWERQYAEAEQLFREAAEGGGQSIYTVPAQLGLAEALTAQGRHDEAITLLNQLAANRDDAVPVDGVLMQLGEANLAAGRESDADAAFRRIVDEFPTSVYVADAEARLDDAME